MALQDGQGHVAGVAIAVVERERRERRAASLQPPRRLGERHELEAAAGDPRERGVEELRRHFEQPVRREGGLPPRPHAMQRQDEAHAWRGHRLVQAGRPHRREAGSDHVALERQSCLLEVAPG